MYLKLPSSLIVVPPEFVLHTVLVYDCYEDKENSPKVSMKLIMGDYLIDTTTRTAYPLGQSLLPTRQ